MLSVQGDRYQEVWALARQDRAQRTRESILDAAAFVFDERGFAGASLSEILDKAGVTKGALYFHFASKEELAQAVIEEQWSMDLPTVDDERTALQDLINLTHIFGHSLYSNLRVRASHRLVTEPNFVSPPMENHQRWVDIAHGFLEAAKSAGDLRPEWEPKVVATWLAGSFLGVQTLSRVLTERADMWRIALPGLVPPRRVARFEPSGTIRLDTAA
jgi:AcrR family transcriptional regulator